MSTATRRKAQAAFEYMVIIGFAFLISVPVIVEAQQSTTTMQQTTEAVTGSSALNTVEEAARFVSSQGNPARLTFDVTMPDDVVYTNATNSFIQIVVDQGAGRNRFINTLPFTVNGTIPAEQGVHEMRVFVNATDAVQLRTVG